MLPPPGPPANAPSDAPSLSRSRKLGDATPKWVDMRSIKTIITADEILAYLPNHTLIYECVVRLNYNGWTQQYIAGANNYFRDVEFKDGMLPNTITRRIQAAERDGNKRLNVNGGQAFKGNRERRMGIAEWRHFSTEAWSKPPSVFQWVDYPLADLAKGVKIRPWGEGHGPLSKCIEFAEQNPQENYMVSDVPRIMAEQGFEHIDPGDRNIDKEALERILSRMEAKRGYLYPEQKDMDRRETVNLRRRK